MKYLISLMILSLNINLANANTLLNEINHLNSAWKKTSTSSITHEKNIVIVYGGKDIINQ